MMIYCISDGRNKKSIVHMFYHLFRGVANTLFTVIPFHNLSDCDIYTPPTTGREEETEVGGERPGQDKTRSSFLNEGLHL